MLLIRALLLWSIISLHVVGGAAIFRRLFPRESPWVGFFVPALALVIIMHFIEHMVAVPSLLGLLPFTISACIWFLFHPATNWKGLRLPAGIFLAAFAFTLAQRALRPDLTAVRDAIPDLGLMASFCLGDKVPPPISWASDLPLSRYYILGHYGISVLTRLLGVDVGTGFNLSSALLSAFDYLLAAAAAWRISRQKIWITVLAPILMAGAATGATAYMWFTVTNLDPNEADDIFSGHDNPNNHSPVLQLIQDRCRHELVPPGAWSWLGSFHSTCGGLFLVLLLVWSISEVLRRRPSNWPWICLGAVPLMTIVTSTWALPFEALLLVGAAFWIWYYQLAPQNLRVTALGLGLAAALMVPILSEYLTTNSFPDHGWTEKDCLIQHAEYLVMWWPIYLPWLALLLAWPRLSPTVKTVLLALPVALLGVDLYTVGNRYDWVGKVWCFIYGAGWVILTPALFRRRALPFRLLSLVIIASSLLSLWAWSSFVWRNTGWDYRDLLHLEGTGPFRWDPVLSTLQQNLSRLQGKTILAGKPDGGISPPLAAFSGNRIYIAWYGYIDTLVAGSPAPDITMQRGLEVDDFYDGKCANPLLFLRTHDISAVVIYPDDKIGTAIVDALKTKLTPYYDYVDCRADKTDTVNAGIFFFHPEMLKWPPSVIQPPANPSPVPVLAKPPEKVPVINAPKSKEAGDAKGKKTKKGGASKT